VSPLNPELPLRTRREERWKKGAFFIRNECEKKGGTIPSSFLSGEETIREGKRTVLKGKWGLLPVNKGFFLVFWGSAAYSKSGRERNAGVEANL